MEISLVPVPARKTSADRRASSTLHRVLAGQYDPAHLDLRVGFGQPHDRAAGTDLNIVAVGPQAKQALHAKSYPK